MAILKKQISMQQHSTEGLEIELRSLKQASKENAKLKSQVLRSVVQYIYTQLLSIEWIIW